MVFGFKKRRCFGFRMLSQLAWSYSWRLQNHNTIRMYNTGEIKSERARERETEGERETQRER